MFLFLNFIVIAILSTCIFVGLDKLIAITLYICILFFSNLFNKITEVLTEKAEKSIISSNKAKILKISNCLFSFLIWLAIASEVICLVNGHGLSVEDSLNSKIFCVCAYLVLFFYGLLAIRLLQLGKPSEKIIPEAQWYRVLQYISIYQLIAGIYFIIIDSFNFSEELREQYNYAQESEPLTHVEVQEIKSIYRRIAKRIHPDVHPETMEDEILRDLWGMTAVSYRARDLEALQTLEIRVRKRIVELGGIDEEDVEIDDLEEKIEQVESEIEKIITTDPYQYSVFLIRDDLVTQRHEDLEEEILQYQKHSIDLQTILENLLSGGDVTV